MVLTTDITEYIGAVAGGVARMNCVVPIEVNSFLILKLRQVPGLAFVACGNKNISFYN